MKNKFDEKTRFFLHYETTSLKIEENLSQIQLTSQKVVLVSLVQMIKK